jgi:hypothetical protein
MKRFLKLVALFGTPILIFFVILEIVVRTIPNDYKYKRKYMEDNAGKIEVLVFGSSHGLYGINPQYFSKNTFNTAHEYQSLKYDKFIFDKYKDNLKSLKAIVIPISYFSLFYELEEGEGAYRVKNYCSYYACPYHSSLKNNFEVMNGRSMILFNMAKNYVFNDVDEIFTTPLGYGKMNRNTPTYDVEKTGLLSAQKQSDFKLENLGPNMERLESMIRDCQSKHVKVYLFLPPSWSSYVRNLEKERLDIIYRQMDMLVKKYPNVKFHSYLNDESFLKSDYRDAYHVNESGAKKLSEMINADLGI